jgi:hypothetical protein
MRDRAENAIAGAVWVCVFYAGVFIAYWLASHVLQAIGRVFA